MHLFRLLCVLLVAKSPLGRLSKFAKKKKKKADRPSGERTPSPEADAAKGQTEDKANAKESADTRNSQHNAYL